MNTDTSMKNLAIQPVLFVDDDPVIAELTKAILGRAGRAVDHCLSAEVAQELYDPRTHPVLVTDLHMPGRDGIDLFLALRSRHPFLRCILISAYLTPETLVRGAESGIHDAIPKPFPDQYRLVEAVERQFYEVRRWKAILRDLKGRRHA